MDDMMQRFREKHGLLGHLSGAIPGLLAPAGPLGQGQHFAMAGAYLHRDKLFPVTIGDGGMGEPYVLNAMMHFHTAYPEITNFLPVLIWNGYSQEHHSMVSLHSNAQMIDYWKGHGFDEVILVDAKEFDDSGQQGAYVDSTPLLASTSAWPLPRRCCRASIAAARSALGGKLTAFIIKQLKGTGVHTVGAKSHNLYPADTLDQPHIIDGLKRRALPPAAWQIVRDNFSRAGGGPAVKTVVTERELELTPLPKLAMQEFRQGRKGRARHRHGCTGRPGRPGRSALRGDQCRRQRGLGDEEHQRRAQDPPPDAAIRCTTRSRPARCTSRSTKTPVPASPPALALFGSRALWLSYESFAINGWPIVQTVTQAMAELRRKTPSHGHHVHRRRTGAGPQRLDPPASGDRELFRRDDAQRQRLSRCSRVMPTASRRPTNTPPTATTRAW